MPYWRLTSIVTSQGKHQITSNWTSQSDRNHFAMTISIALLKIVQVSSKKGLLQLQEQNINIWGYLVSQMGISGVVYQPPKKLLYVS